MGSELITTPLYLTKCDEPGCTAEITHDVGGIPAGWGGCDFRAWSAAGGSSSTYRVYCPEHYRSPTIAAPWREDVPSRTGMVV